MSDIVDRLKDLVVDVPGHGKGVRASITSADLEEAADEIERLRDLAHEQYAHADDLKARIAEAVEVLRATRDRALSIINLTDTSMDPELSAQAIVPIGARLVEIAYECNAVLAKLEGRSGE